MASSIMTAIAPILSVLIIAAIILLAVVFVGKVMYKKAPPNVAMVITGPRGNRVAIGKGCFVIPIIQRVDYMSLENIQSDFTSRDEIPTKDAINILVDAVANVSISQNPDRLKVAASKFLGYKPSQIREIITPVFEGNIREIISQTTLKELIQGDKKVFAERIIENVTPNLNDMGLELTTFNIQNFKDKNGVIENLGLENTVQISKDAAISKAKAEKEIAVAKAEAAKAANDAKVAADTEIAKQAEADMQVILDAIQESQLDRAKKEDEAKIATEKQLAEIEKARQTAYAETVANIMKSVSPDLVAALTSKANASMLETVTKSMSPYAIAQGESVADVTNQLLRGTTLEEVIENMAAAKNE